MRIAYLVNSKWPNVRGAERFLLSLCEYGRSIGHDATVLAPEASAIHGACDAIGIRSVRAEFSPAPAAVSRLRAALAEVAPDVVQGMSLFPVALVRRLALLPADAGVRYFGYVSTDPTSSMPVASTRFRRPLRLVRNAISRWEAPRFDAIFVPSEAVRGQLAQAGIGGRIVVIPGMIDFERLIADALQPLALPPERPRIGYAGFLEQLKGIDDLIDAFALVAETHPSARLVIAGDGPERERLKQQAARLGVGDRVDLLGVVDPIAPFLRGLDVFVSPSHSEAAGRSIMEAMALGLPCVCTDAGGISQVIRDGVSGLLVDVGDSAGMAAAIGRLLDDPALAATIAENGRALITTEEYELAASLRRVFTEYAEARTPAPSTEA